MSNRCPGGGRGQNLTLSCPRLLCVLVLGPFLFWLFRNGLITTLMRDLVTRSRETSLAPQRRTRCFELLRFRSGEWSMNAAAVHLHQTQQRLFHLHQTHSTASVKSPIHPGASWTYSTIVDPNLKQLGRHNATETGRCHEPKIHDE